MKKLSFQKEAFLLEHGFYDEEVRKFANKAPKIKSVYADYGNLFLPFWIDEARKEWFKRNIGALCNSQKMM
jgi:hypothetical protein